MATYYWVGGSGTWDNSNTANWSTSSGGAGGAGPPTASDSAIINTVSHGSSFTITLASTAAALFATIGNTNVTVQQSGNVSNIGTLSLYGGTYDANNYNLTADQFIMTSGLVSGVTVNGPRTVTMGSGTWAVKTWTALSSNTTFNKNTANILLRSQSGTSSVFTGGGFTYNKITFTEAAAGLFNTYSFEGSSTFTEVASANTRAFTINIGSTGNATLSTYSWTASGSLGNVITIGSLSTSVQGSLVKLGGGYIAGVDYMSIGNFITATPTDTWYFGSNSTFILGGTTSRPNRTTGIFNTVRSQNAVVVLTSTSSTTWTVPLDWNNAQNTIHLFGGGGGGGGGYASTSYYGGGGGGGGGYTKLTNQSLSIGASITYQAGAGGAAGAAAADGSAGNTTSWNSGAATAGGGGGGSRSSTGGTAGTGTTYNGGVGGAGGSSTVGNASGGGGGAGAGGPNGTGGAGGSGVSNATAGTSGNSNGGGGGGSGGGAAGANATTSGAAVGGNNFSGVGRGTVVAMSGSQGGGSAGAYAGFPFNNTSSGGNGIDIFGTGSGGGLGGRAAETSPIQTNAKGGSFGGGGGGGYTDGTDRQGFAGGQGAIVIVYTPVNRGNFLAFFEP